LNVVYYHNLPAFGCRATESLIERDAGVRCKTAGEWSNNQKPGIHRVYEIKAYPVVLRHLFVQTLSDALHQCLRRSGSSRPLLEFSEKLLMYTSHGYLVENVGLLFGAVYAEYTGGLVEMNIGKVKP
jgi:hypothetical protein